MKTRVFVTLKPSVFDPQGQTIADALHSMGYTGIGVEVWNLALTLGAEGGYAFQGVSGQVSEGTDVAIAGPWMALSAGIGWGQ